MSYNQYFMSIIADLEFFLYYLLGDVPSLWLGFSCTWYVIFFLCWVISTPQLFCKRSWNDSKLTKLYFHFFSSLYSTLASIVFTLIILSSFSDMVPHWNYLLNTCNDAGLFLCNLTHSFIAFVIWLYKYEFFALMETCTIDESWLGCFKSAYYHL